MSNKNWFLSSMYFDSFQEKFTLTYVQKNYWQMFWLFLTSVKVKKFNSCQNSHFLQLSVAFFLVTVIVEFFQITFQAHFERVSEIRFGLVLFNRPRVREARQGVGNGADKIFRTIDRIIDVNSVAFEICGRKNFPEEENCHFLSGRQLETSLQLARLHFRIVTRDLSKKPKFS